MRTFGIALAIAWITVGMELFLTPPTMLNMELSSAKRMLEQMKDSPLNSADIPVVQEGIKHAKQLLADPSSRETILWVKWTALLLLVVFGLWAAYAAIRRRRYAGWIAIAVSVLFLIRQAVFHRGNYELLFGETNVLVWWIKNGYYQFAINTLWYDYVLALFFFLVVVIGLARLLRPRATTVQAL